MCRGCSAGVEWREREEVRGGFVHIYIYIYNECVTMGKQI